MLNRTQIEGNLTVNLNIFAKWTVEAVAQHNACAYTRNNVRTQAERRGQPHCPAGEDSVASLRPFMNMAASPVWPLPSPVLNDLPGRSLLPADAWGPSPRDAHDSQRQDHPTRCPTTTNDGRRTATQSCWSHLWSHPSTFACVHQCFGSIYWRR